jgi:hypothetical protein
MPDFEILTHLAVGAGNLLLGGHGHLPKLSSGGRVDKGKVPVMIHK